MWPFGRFFATPQKRAEESSVFFTNTLSGKRELFAPLKPGLVTMYSCGPTVYSRAHLGNLRSFVFADTIARVLRFAGYRVIRVMNVTDVGHLVGDADEGEDKMTVGAKREGRTPEEIANRYTKLFLEDIAALNVNTADILFPRASEYIQEQIAMVKTLEEKGFAYVTKEGVYFDTSRFANYGMLGGREHMKLHEDRPLDQARGNRIKTNPEKRNSNDFALWRNAKPHDLQQWDSPWGRGNPGWHIECSAMSRALLGLEIDIHTGGMDHIGVHHTNEIAQSESVSGRPFVRYWLHNAFLTMKGEKVSKSLGNVFSLSDVIDRGFHPLALRYFFLQAHYHTPLSFSWDALAASAEALTRLWRMSHEIAIEAGNRGVESDAKKRARAMLFDDVATPQAIGFLWEVFRDEELSAKERYGVLEAADAVLGLSLLAPPDIALPHGIETLPDETRTLAKERDEARKEGDFAKADALRERLHNSGYRVEDGPEGTLLTRQHQ